MSLGERLWGQEHQLKPKEELAEVIRVLRDDLVKVNSNIQIFVFGSVARGQATHRSDIDLAVILSDDLNKKQFIKDFYHFRTRTNTPVDFIFKTKSEFENDNESPIAQVIKETGIEIYPHWMLLYD